MKAVFLTETDGGDFSASVKLKVSRRCHVLQMNEQLLRLKKLG